MIRFAIKKSLHYYSKQKPFTHSFFATNTNLESSGGATFIPLATESAPVQHSEPVTTPDTPSRRRRSSRSKTKSPSPTRALKMEPPVLAPVSEEVAEALEPELVDDDDEMSAGKGDNEMIDEDALLSDEPAKMEVDVAKEGEVRTEIQCVVFTR